MLISPRTSQSRPFAKQTPNNSILWFLFLFQFIISFASTSAQLLSSSSSPSLLATSTSIPTITAITLPTTSISRASSRTSSVPTVFPTPTEDPGNYFNRTGDGDDDGSPLVGPDGDDPPDPETPSEITRSQILNLYFLILAIGVILLLAGLHFYRKRKSEKLTQSRQRGQNALRRDLESGGWRVGVNGFGRWGAGRSAARSRNARVEEGLDERGEAPPPYSPKREENGMGAIALNPITIPRQVHTPSTSMGDLRGTRRLGLGMGIGTRDSRLPSYEDVTNCEGNSRGERGSGTLHPETTSPATLASLPSNTTEVAHNINQAHGAIHSDAPSSTSNPTTESNLQDNRIPEVEHHSTHRDPPPLKDL